MQPAATGGAVGLMKGIHPHDEFLPAQHDRHTNTKRKDQIFPHRRIQTRLQL